MDQEIEFLKQSETGAITDAMKLVGVRGWMFGIYPIRKDMKVCGRAFTVQFSMTRDSNEHTYNIFEVLDMCKPGDVIVISAHSDYATIGENIMHAAQNLGIAGMVLDGRTRDCNVCASMEIPHFTCGPAIEVRSDFKITGVQVPVICGGAPVCPGDYIVGDVDGVISIPKACIKDVIYQAEKVAAVEKEFEQALNQKLPMEEIIKVSNKKKVRRP